MHPAAAATLIALAACGFERGSLGGTGPEASVPTSEAGPPPGDASRTPTLDAALDAGTAACTATCGDQTCCLAAGETASTCSADCGSCATTCTSCTNGCCTQACQNCSPSCSGCQCRLDVSGGGDTSTPTCSNMADCTVDCRNTRECYADCSGNSKCDIDCGGNNAECDIDCLSGSQCLLRCQGAVGATCQFTTCNGTQLNCPGNIKVCNRPCP